MAFPASVAVHRRRWTAARRPRSGWDDEEVIADHIPNRDPCPTDGVHLTSAWEHVTAPLFAVCLVYPPAAPMFVHRTIQSVLHPLFNALEQFGEIRAFLFLRTRQMSASRSVLHRWLSQNAARMVPLRGSSVLPYFLPGIPCPGFPEGGSKAVPLTPAGSGVSCLLCPQGQHCLDSFRIRFQQPPPTVPRSRGPVSSYAPSLPASTSSAGVASARKHMTARCSDQLHPP